MGSLIRSMARHRARSMWVARTAAFREASVALAPAAAVEVSVAPPAIKPDKGLLGGSCNRTAWQAPGATWVHADSGAHYCRSCALEINRWARRDHGTPLCSPIKPVEPRHCDDYIDDPTQPECLRRFLAYSRLPAAAKYPTGDADYDAGMEAHLGCPMWRDPVPTLFADHDGRRVRVTMASRFGDVGITNNLAALNGYGRRVAVEDLSNFGETPV